MPTEAEKDDFAQTLRMLPGYPFLPCPICVKEGFRGMDGCDHIVAERARAALPGLIFPQSKAANQ